MNKRVNIIFDYFPSIICLKQNFKKFSLIGFIKGIFLAKIDLL